MDHVIRNVLLRWSAEDLVREAALGLATIRRAEGAENETSMTTANDLAVRGTLEGRGVEFIDENGGGPRGAATQAATEEGLAVGSKTGVCRTGQAARGLLGWGRGKLARAAGSAWRRFSGSSKAKAW
jgi:hypothetical protein